MLRFNTHSYCLLKVLLVHFCCCGILLIADWTSALGQFRAPSDSKWCNESFSLVRRLWSWPENATYFFIVQNLKGFLGGLMFLRAELAGVQWSFLINLSVQYSACVSTDGYWYSALCWEGENVIGIQGDWIKESRTLQKDPDCLRCELSHVCAWLGIV